MKNNFTPEVMIELIITSNQELDNHFLDKIVGINSTSFQHIGHKLRSGIICDYSTWLYKTEYIKTYYAEKVVSDVLNKINLCEVLSSELKKINADFKVSLVLRIVENNTPSLILSKEVIEKLNLLNASLEVDILA